MRSRQENQFEEQSKPINVATAQRMATSALQKKKKKPGRPRKVKKSDSR